MKRPDKVMGFLSYNGKQYSFICLDDKLQLLPPDEKTQKEDFLAGFTDFSKRQEERSKFVETLELNGKISDDESIYFKVLNKASNHNGYICFPIYYYLLYNSGLMQPTRIDGFYLRGQAIDGFYPPQHAIKTDVEERQDKNHPFTAAVTARVYDEESCGVYISNGVSVHVEASVTVYLKYDDRIPLSAESVLSFSFDKSVDIEAVTTEIYSAKLMLMYLSYRRNVKIDDVELFTLDKNRKRYNCGLLVSFLGEKFAPESFVNAKKQIIQYRYLKDKTATLISLFGPSEQNSSSSIYVEHLCPSIKGISHYTVARIVSIFTAFEREFREIYGQNFERSDDYIEMLKLAVELVDSEASKRTGNSRNHLIEIKKALQKFDISLSQKLCHALNDCESIMEPFVRQSVDKSIFEMRDEFAQRMNTLRNDVTHGNSTFRTEPMDLPYLNYVELLLYAMRLKSIGIEPENIKAALSDLFQVYLPPSV
jgi:hypothetical protein